MSISPLLAYLIVKSGEYDKLKEFVEKAEKFETGDVTTLEMISKEEPQMLGGMMRPVGSRRPETPATGQPPSEREKKKQSELKAVAEAKGKGKAEGAETSEGTPAAEAKGKGKAEEEVEQPAAEAKGKGKAGEVVEQPAGTVVRETKEEPNTAAVEAAEAKLEAGVAAEKLKKEADAKEGKGGKKAGVAATVSEGQGAKTLIQTQLLEQIKNKLTADEVMELFVLILKMIEK